MVSALESLIGLRVKNAGVVKGEYILLDLFDALPDNCQLVE